MQALWLTRPTNCQGITSVLFIRFWAAVTRSRVRREYISLRRIHKQAGIIHSSWPFTRRRILLGGFIHTVMKWEQCIYTKVVSSETRLSSNWFFIQGTLCCPPDTADAPCRPTVRRVAAQLHRALSEKGLAFLVNHSIPDGKVRAGTLEDDANFRHIGCPLDLAAFAHKTVLSDSPVKIRPACQVSTRQANKS